MTINDVFFAVARSGHREAMLAQGADGAWRPVTGAEVYRRVLAVSRGLRRWGVHKGDRVAILAENRWEWAVADYATLALGAVDVPIYPTLPGEHVAVLLKDSGAKVVFVSTRAQYEKVEAVRAQTSIEQIVMMEDGSAPEAESFASLLQNAGEGEQDEEFDRGAEAVAAGDLATLIYTSGTTGEPKGVMLTHGNIASNLNYSLAEFDIGAGDRCLSFLPLSHITARHLDYALFVKGATVAYCPKFDTLPQAMAEVRPTIFVGVPRVFEKVRQAVEQKSAGSAIKKKLLGWAVGVGRRHLEEMSAGKLPDAYDWKLAHRLIYSKIAKAFGGRVRIFIAGGAPLGMDTASWFGAVGIRILEGYGLTETSPVLALNSPGGYRMGSVGRPLPNVQCRIAEDGELLVKGPNVFVGYWQKLEDTAESFEDGWFKTGDISRLDGDGFLYVTDRKKELLKTSGGKLIAPQPIEGRLKGHLLVAQAALVGDKHKFAAALIAPNFSALEAWAVQQGVKAGSRRELIEHPVVVAAFQVIVEQVNEGLAGYETIKRFRLVADEWALETGELTPSLKLKRRVINEKYSAEIADLYKDEAVAHG
jgi:long-chain acyl-CoA synthetase